ncbi:arsenate reductase [Kingella potus]|uniref:Arsenate reductase n=1 Tax=Kingella potus TaxID=265175 RepID=A0A377QZV0_9NEIS|nr:arsenate reductase (glutaredoxin) [Kingella potus]STR00522.1 arsenate reductase [Kingella potus]
MNVTLYHNPRCSKSRAAAEWLAEQGVATHIVRYLDRPLDAAALRDLAGRLGLSDVRGMMRTKDDLYRSLDLDGADNEALIAALAAHPALLERPIAVIGAKAAIGRPLENIAALLRQEQAV